MHTKPQLWLALRFPTLALNVLPHNAALPTVVLDKKRVCVRNELAIDLGIRHHMPAATAQAMSEKLVMLERNVEAEQKMLDALCDECYSVTPYIESSLTPAASTLLEYGIFLEISRCINLFKSLDNIEYSISCILERYQLTAIQSYGHTAQAAWLIGFLPAEQRYSPHDNINGPAALEALKRVPLNFLLDFQKEVSTLKKMGFVYLGDLFDKKNNALGPIKKRFSIGFFDYIEKTFAVDAFSCQASLFQEKPRCYQQKNIFIDYLQCEYPIGNIDWLAQPMKQLLERLTQFLSQHQLQTQEIQWLFFDIEQNKKTLDVQFERLHKRWHFVLELSLIKLESQGLPFEVDIVELRCDKLTAVNFEYKTLIQQPESTPKQYQQNLELILAKLGARLGEKSLYKLSCRDSHVPEYAVEKISATQNANTEISASHRYAPRPNWLFDNPIVIELRHEALYWRGYLNLINGPERMESEWWNDEVARDYYVALRDDGVRVWVFYDLKDEKWFVHGVFG